MSLNCKPGDLAVWVGRTEDMAACYGRIVRVTALDSRYPGTPSWFYEGELFCVWTNKRPSSVFDFWLRPLRNPGDEEEDETLSWLPVPQEVTA